MAQSLIIHHNENKQRCAAKDNWASQIREVALRKKLEQWKFPFPPSGQLLRNSNQHKMLQNCLEEDVCLYCPNARWEGKFWVAKDSLRTTAGELQKIVESWGQKTLKMVKQHLHHHMLFRRGTRKSILAHPKTNSSIFSYQTRLELQMGLASMIRWN